MGVHNEVGLPAAINWHGVDYKLVIEKLADGKVALAYNAVPDDPEWFLLGVVNDNLEVAKASMARYLATLNIARRGFDRIKNK